MDSATNAIVESGMEDDAKKMTGPPITASTHRRDPLRCRRCDSLRKTGHLSSSSSSSLSYTPCIIDVVMGGRTLLVRVSPEPELEAIVNGLDIVCVVGVSCQRTGWRKARSGSSVVPSDAVAARQKQRVRLARHGTGSRRSTSLLLITWPATRQCTTTTTRCSICSNQFHPRRHRGLTLP
jgi:hypothetical protein